MATPEEFLNSPQIRGFAQVVAQQVAGQTSQVFAQTLQQAMQQIADTISPAGRPVEVRRRNAQNLPVKMVTTTPQLLAELNDSIQDLIDELRISNELAEQIRSEQRNNGQAPRRRRRELVD